MPSHFGGLFFVDKSPHPLPIYFVRLIKLSRLDHPPFHDETRLLCSRFSGLVATCSRMLTHHLQQRLLQLRLMPAKYAAQNGLCKHDY